MKFLDRLRPLSFLILRVILALIFIYHGYPKLTHTHGNLQGMFVEHGMPGYFTQVAGVIETIGGTLLLLGLFARPAAFLIALEMCVAIWKVHSLHGIYAVRDYEFPLALAGACFVVATVGAGPVSIDRFIFDKSSGGRSGGGGSRPRAKSGGRNRDRDFE
ncbi:MAG TPA: DoxX family protein [Candidatus Acidoferrum sp.]